jgi:hypothetical protein
VSRAAGRKCALWDRVVGVGSLKQGTGVGLCDDGQQAVTEEQVQWTLSTEPVLACGQQVLCLRHARMFVLSET